MTRLRLLAGAAGAGVLLATLPALAVAAPGPAGVPPTAQETVAQREQRAQALLVQAARAATSRPWSGTQYVGTWRGATQTSAVLEVEHRPGRGSTIRTGNGAAVVTPELDERLLGLLADHYDLAVAGRGRCAGRPAHVVEARRPGRTGAGAVAGRFWLDTASGLVLRREVYDAEGDRLTSSAFVEVTVQAPVTAARTGTTARDEQQAELTGRGWRPPRRLPGGLELFDAQVREHDGGRVLHLAYSDGLSTLSVFAQKGTLPASPRRGFDAAEVRGTRAWVQPAAPERVVWAGEGRVFTLVSDAAPATVRAAVGVLPRDPAPRSGLLARLGRGLARLGSWINPL